MLIKKIVFFAFIIFSIFVINEFAHSIYSLWQKASLIDATKQALSLERKKNTELKDKLKTVSQPQFIEEEARNKLFLAKPGEGIIVVAPTQYLPATTSARQKEVDTRPYWLQWWDTFFKT